MRRSVRLLATALLAGLSLVSLPSRAQVEPPATQVWRLEGVTFNDLFNAATGQRVDGGTLTGFFVLDAVTRALLSWEFTSTAGAATCNTGGVFSTCTSQGHTFDTSNSHLVNPVTGVINTRDPVGSPLVVQLNGLPTFLGLTLTFTGDPARVALNTNSGEEFGPGSRGIATGFAVHAVPEPDTYLMMLAGLGVVVVAVRRARARRRS